MTMFLQTLARAGRKYDCLERHSPRIGAEFLTQSLSQGIDDLVRIIPPRAFIWSMSGLPWISPRAKRAASGISFSSLTTATLMSVNSGSHQRFRHPDLILIIRERHLVKLRRISWEETCSDLMRNSAEWVMPV